MNISIVARRPFFDKFYLNPSFPGFLRLALSDSLSFNPSKNTGGAINNYNNHHFLKLKVNSGLKHYLKEVNDIQADGNHITNMLHTSDLIQIGGAAAIEYCGGPKIDIKIGRKPNATNLSEATSFPDPDFNLDDIKSKLGSDLNLSSTEIVALFGHRTLGFYSNKLNHKEARWSINPFVFDNNYYSELLNKNSVYLKTPSDKALLSDSEYLEIVEKFAANQTLFFEEFKKVYIKVSEFGNDQLLEEKLAENI